RDGSGIEGLPQLLALGVELLGPPLLVLPFDQEVLVPPLQLRPIGALGTLSGIDELRDDAGTERFRLAVAGLALGRDGEALDLTAALCLFLGADPQRSQCARPGVSPHEWMAPSISRSDVASTGRTPK